MKKINIWGILAGILLLTACQDWLDISPKTNIKTEDFFKTEDGFKSAIVGIYGRMTISELYGENLSFLFLERLAQRYDNNKNETPEVRREWYNYNYNQSSKDKIASIWSAMYKNIANINNLLKYLETHGQNIKTPGYYELIKGEALGLRAFHYFELIRMWGPVHYERDKAVKVVPWRDQFTPDKVPLMTADSVVGHILEDLKNAEALLKNDPMDYLHNGTEPFVGYRQHRMNRYAVKALMARVYLWIGDKEEAGKKASEVIEKCGLVLMRDNQKDQAFFKETLFGLNMFNMEYKLTGYFPARPGQNQNNLWVSIADLTDEVYDGKGIGINDIRYKNGYGFIQMEQDKLAMTRKYLVSGNSDYNEKIPLIRLSEMYYILAESLPLEEAATPFNTVRNARGISKIHNLRFTDSNHRQKELEKEYQKDFYAEGQFFYFLKRINASTFHRCPFEEGMKEAYYIFPIPDAEIEFGLVDQ